MEEITNNEKNILNSFKEHLKVIRDEIKTFTEMKDLSVSEYLNAKKELDILLKKIDSANTELNTIKSVSRETEDKAKSIIEDANNKNKKAESILIEAEKEEQDTKDRVKNLIKDADIKIAELSTTAKLMQENIDLLTTSINDLRKKEESTKSGIDSSIIKLQNEEQSLRNNIEVLNNEITQKQKDIVAFTKKLVDVQKQVNDEMEKVLLPTKILEEKELELNRSYKNLKIMQDRFKRRFKEIFPNQELNI